MASYPQLMLLMAGVPPQGPEHFRDVVPYLVDVWVTDYERTAGKSDVVQVSSDGFSYLFDLARERLLAAWGISKGRHGAQRPAARMAGHPLSAGAKYHRGHSIPHTLGGPADINLVPQLGSVNIGPFRVLEKRAVASPGSLYFTYWIYAPGPSQTPLRVDQGLLIPGRPPEIRTHPN